MTIQFFCAQCSALIQVDDWAACKAGRCPQCQTKLLVPRESDPSAAAQAHAAEQQAALQPQYPSPGGAPPYPGQAGGWGQPPAEQPSMFPGPASPQIPQVGESAAPFPPQPAAGPFPAQPAAEDPFGAPIIQAPNPSATPMARKLKLRGRKQGGKLVPLIFFGLLIAGTVAYYIMNRPTLTGTLPGEVLVKVELPPGYITPNIAPGISKEDFLSVRDELSEFPLDVKTQIMQAEFRGTSKGIQFKVSQGDETELIRVTIGRAPFLQQYYADHQKELAAPLNEELQEAGREFFQAIKEQGRDLDTALKTRFRDRLGLNAMLGGLGYNVAANAAGTLYYCVAESAEGDLYFVMPKGTKTFTIEPRPFKDGMIRLPENFRYVVNVSGGRSGG